VGEKDGTRDAWFRSGLPAELITMCSGRSWDISLYGSNLVENRVQSPPLRVPGFLMVLPFPSLSAICSVRIAKRPQVCSRTAIRSESTCSHTTLRVYISKAQKLSILAMCGNGRNHIAENCNRVASIHQRGRTRLVRIKQVAAGVSLILINWRIQR